jgi:ABC-2 type transport system ATP-binding protein
MTEVIRCTGVVKRFGSVVALDGLDLTVRAGVVVGYLGPNGAGKTTTLRILVDLARPDAGEVRVLGVDPRGSDPAVRRRIGYLPGELRLDERLDVATTLHSWAALRGGEVDEAYLRSLCDRLDLDPTRRTRGLSTGNRRKVGLVGAFMSRPELLVLDEPTSGLDPLVQAEFAELVREARIEGRTVLLSSHVLSEVHHLADEVVVIRAGSTVFTGDVDQLRQRARQPFTVWFADGVPADELRAAPGVAQLDVRGAEANGVVEGSPDGLLAVLARHRTTHVVLPEPDLEDAFLHYYEDAAS